MPDPTAQANSDSPAAAAASAPSAHPAPARPVLGRALVVLLALLLLALAAGALLLSAIKTEAGSRRLLSLVPGLQVEGLRGPLAGDLDIRSLSYPLGPSQTLHIDGLSWRTPVLDWPSGQAPALRLARLQIGTIDLQGRSTDSAPTVLPRSLVLPLSLHIDEIRIGRLMLDGLREQPLQDLSARLALPAGPAGLHRLDAIRLRRDQLQLRGRLEIGAAAPLPVQAQFSARAEAGPDGSGSGNATLPTDWQLDLGLSGPQAIGITRGGLNTKIHAVCDALGNPLRFVLTAGQRHDSQPVSKLLDGLAAKALLADKAYDSDKVVQAAEKQSMEVIIPCRVNRKKNPRVLDKHRYKARHLVENLFQRMKVFRRVATRYDKLDVTFLGFVYIAGTMKWLH